MLNLANIYKKYRSKLLTFVKGQVNIEEDAEDILHNVFLHLTLQDKAQEVENVLAWLYKVAKNSIIDFRRKAKEVEIPQLKLQDEDGDFLVDFTEMLADDEDNIPDKVYIRTLVWEELQQALEELPDNQREVFIETAINGRSIKELSQRTGVLEKTLLSRKHYAVTYLRRRLANLYEELLT